MRDRNVIITTVWWLSSVPVWMTFPKLGSCRAVRTRNPFVRRRQVAARTRSSLTYVNCDHGVENDDRHSTAILLQCGLEL